jgi:hypothetical protein
VGNPSTNAQAGSICARSSRTARRKGAPCAAKRQWAYDRDSPVGRLSKALDAAPKHGWIVVDMKKEWKVIFPFEK